MKFGKAVQELLEAHNQTVDAQTRAIKVLQARTTELQASLAKWGDHASDCAYRLAHYKGPVPACDCGWNEYVASLTPASGGVK
jgi:hypothetical protein